MIQNSYLTPYIRREIIIVVKKNINKEYNFIQIY
jgi:hypothetical protein